MDFLSTVKGSLLACCGDHTVDLGICVPHGDRFGIDTKVPIKRFGEGTMTFRLVPKHNKIEGTFLPVSPDEPFSYIQKLQQAHLATQGGLVGVVVTEDQSSKESPIGQWSEPITEE